MQCTVYPQWVACNQDFHVPFESMLASSRIRMDGQVSRRIDPRNLNLRHLGKRILLVFRHMEARKEPTSTGREKQLHGTDEELARERENEGRQQ
jgi:hypothetical protein